MSLVCFSQQAAVVSLQNRHRLEALGVNCEVISQSSHIIETASGVHRLIKASEAQDTGKQTSDFVVSVAFHSCQFKTGDREKTDTRNVAAN
jgi:hypothetical protein